MAKFGSLGALQCARTCGMQKSAMAALLVSLLLMLAACGGTKHTALKLPPKACRMTSTRAACRDYLIMAAIECQISGGAACRKIRDVRFRKNISKDGVYRTKPLPMDRWVSCPSRQYPVLCKKR